VSVKKCTPLLTVRSNGVVSNVLFFKGKGDFDFRRDFCCRTLCALDYGVRAWVRARFKHFKSVVKSYLPATTGADSETVTLQQITEGGTDEKACSAVDRSSNDHRNM
jgi:hypothetical protein